MENTHQFSSPLARDLFSLGASTMQDQLAEAWEGVPRYEPTAEDLNRAAAIKDETFSEGRISRTQFRTNFKE